MIMRYGLDNTNEYTQKEVAEKINKIPSNFPFIHDTPPTNQPSIPRLDLE